MKYYPTYLQSFGLLFIYLLCVILSLLVVVPFVSYESAIGLSLMYVISISLTIGAALVIRKDFTFPWKNFSPLIVVIASISLLGIQLFLDPLTNLIPLSDMVKKMITESIQHPVIYFFMIVVAAPLFEELLFRGIILDGLLKNYQPVRAIVFSALMFALVHGNLSQGVGAFLGGIVMGWIYWKTQSVLPGILIHFFNNLASFVGVILTPKEDVFKSTYETIGNPIVYWLIIIGCGIIAVLGIWLLHKKYLKELSPVIVSEKDKPTLS